MDQQRSNPRGVGAVRAKTPPARPIPFVVRRTVHDAFEGKIFAGSAAAAFWQTLSLPPLLLGLLGSLGFASDWIGAPAIDAVRDELLRLAHTVFTPNVVRQIIDPTVQDILTRGRSGIVSVGFLLSLWAGSSALSSLVDWITVAYHQATVRHGVWQRIFVLLLYVASLLVALVVLPVIALGPGWLLSLLPSPVRDTTVWLVSLLYYPTIGLLLILALATLYKVALPRKLPWHRGLPGALLAVLVFLCCSIGLRIYYTWVTSTGYTYGALGAPITFLLFEFCIGLSVLLGAYLNSTIQQGWPARPTRAQRRRWHRLELRRIAQRARTDAGVKAWRDESGSPRTGGPASSTE